MQDTNVAQFSDVDDILRTKFERKISVCETGRKKQMSMLELVAKAQLKAAATGNVSAQRDIVKQARDLERRDAERIVMAKEAAEREREEKIETYRAIEGWKHRLEREWAETEADNTTPASIWPHPDDIMLFPKSYTWYPRGPFDEADIPMFERICAERDYLFAYSALLGRTYKSNVPSWKKVYDIMWVYYDAQLPLSWQITHNYIRQMLLLDIKSLPKLKKYVQENEEARDLLQLVSGLRPNSKEGYQFANSILKPLCQKYGYRSVAEFDAAFAEHGANIAWPKMISEQKQ